MFNNIVNLNSNNNVSLDETLERLTKVNCGTFYRGIVVDNVDNEHLGRIRVRIPSLHGLLQSDAKFVPSSNIPYATPAIFSSSGNDSGSYLIPNVGDVVFVTFENDSANNPIYFGGIPRSNITNQDRTIGSSNINNGNEYTYNNNDSIKDIVNGTERVIYKSLKGATIILDDYDGEEYIKIIDQSGQVITMENFGDSLNRRGNELGLSERSKVTITNKQGDVVSLKNGQVYLKTNNLVIETSSLDIPGLERNFSLESTKADLINGELVVAYDSATDSDAIVYQNVVNEIIGINERQATFWNIINKANAMLKEINDKESEYPQHIYNQEMVTLAEEMSDNIIGEGNND